MSGGGRPRRPFPYHSPMGPRIAAVLAAAALLWLAAAPARAAATVFLDELTWTELRDAVKAGATTVIVPVGGTEQSGPHMTLGKHNVRVRALAGRIAAELGHALVAPVIAYAPEGNVSPPTSHMRFPGTISVPVETFEKTLEYAARSLRQAGFRDIVLIGDHGGYQSSLSSVERKLDREWAATPVRVHAVLRYYRALEETYKTALKARGYSDDEIGIHAGLADASLALAVDPRIVRADRMKEPPRAADGTYGDPRRAKAELGELGVNAIVRETVEAIRQAERRR